jgi:hypothetical protein
MGKLRSVLKEYNLNDPASVLFFIIGVGAVISICYIAVISAITYNIKFKSELAVAADTGEDFNGFKTDITRSSISIDKIYNKGPVKGSIPSINNPKFELATNSNLQDQEQGILINFENKTQKFYPLDILVWHEVINDAFGYYPFAVTYSPLTGTAAVFERKINDRVLLFGATGMLYESNLIMYDSATESLWSQNERRAVVGEYNGTNLNLIKFNLSTYKDAKEKYPDLKVLTTNTGFSRDYNNNPYEDYSKKSDIYPEFGITDINTDHFSKALVYSVPYEGKVYSVLVDELKNKPAVFDNGIVISEVDKEINAKINGVSLDLPGYYEMWFSWAIKHSVDGFLDN